MSKLTIFFILFALSPYTVSFAQNQLVIGGIEGSINHAIGAAILKEAYESINYQVSFKTYPAKRSLIMANAGNLDGEVQRIDGINSEYQNLIKVPVPLFDLLGSVYTITIFIKIDGWNSLRPYTIGIRRGVKFAEKGTEGMSRIIAESEKQQIELLKNGRVGLIVSSQFAMDKYIKKHNIKNIFALNPPVDKEPLFHYLHKNNAHLVNKISKALCDMKNSGRSEDIQKEILAKIGE